MPRKKLRGFFILLILYSRAEIQYGSKALILTCEKIQKPAAKA